MAYDPENNPYIPGDPASYDLKWVIDRLNEHKFAEESAAEAKASAEAAEASAQEASGYADDAEGYRDAASGFADDASGYADDAEGYRDEAADYAAHIADPVSGLVTSWLDDNITQPTTPVVDTSLSVLGAAADSWVTGNVYNRNVNSDSDRNSVLLSSIAEIRKYDFTWIADSYVNDNTGAIIAYNGWHRTDYIEIDREKLYLYATSSSPTQRYNCWYDKDKQFISSFLCNALTEIYEPPVNAKYFILSTSNANSIQYGQLELGSWKTKIFKYPQAYIKEDTLSANASFATPFGAAVKSGLKCGFYGAFSGAFDNITLQLDAYSPNQIIIDASNVTIKSRNAADIVQPHGITINREVYVNFMTEYNAIKVKVSSGGSQNTIEAAFNNTSYEVFTLINGSQAFTEYILTLGCADINHNIWVFGDSYLGTVNNNRWPYYLVQDGYTKNVMLCGSSGSGAAEFTLWYNSLMSIAIPKCIIWAMGMNYPSDSGAPAASWKAQFDSLAAYCDANDIEFIPCTIPTVPAVNNEYKDSYIRSSGYRYIDFAKAVGAQADGTWYAGMLSSDNLHPTTAGAIALYNQAIATVPELTYN